MDPGEGSTGGEPDPWASLPLDPDIGDGDGDGDGSVVVPAPPAGTRTAGGRADPRILAVIALGAMPGATARYALSRLAPVHTGGFPWATFWTNVSGSFALGFLLVVLVERLRPIGRAPRYARVFAGTGFLGAYTTFSTFSVEADVLVKDGHGTTALAYVVASLVVGLAAAFAGMVAARGLPGATGPGRAVRR